MGTEGWAGQCRRWLAGPVSQARDVWLMFFAGRHDFNIDESGNRSNVPLYCCGQVGILVGSRNGDRLIGQNSLVGYVSFIHIHTLLIERSR